MKALPLFVTASLLFSGYAQAGRIDVCDVSSEFDLRIERDALVFHRDSGAPARVEMRGGDLIVDGEMIDLSDRDRSRIRGYERDVRDMVPEVKKIAIDAVGIAAEAVIHVAATFSGHREGTTDRLEELSSIISDKIDRSVDTADWDNAEFDVAIESLVGELVPMIAGDIAATAVVAALSGDNAAIARIEAQADEVEKAIEQKVEQRADELEARAEGLCPRFVALDAIEQSLDYRLAGNAPLDLLQIDD